jgi:hypothetical protein
MIRRAFGVGFASAVAAVAGLGVAASAEAATTIGQTDPTILFCFTPAAQVQDISPIDSIPFDGVITSFTAASNAAGTETKLLILQPVSGTTYNVAAKSSAGNFTGPGVQTFPTRLTVRAGQLIGNSGRVCDFFSSGDRHHLFSGPEPATGADQSFPATGPDDARTNLSATLELDADHDGFGDETQDQCPTNATTQGPCPPAAATTPTTPTTPAGKDPKCEHLRKKLERQQKNLAKAGSQAKRSMIQANIEDTKKRLQKLGC